MRVGNIRDKLTGDWQRVVQYAILVLAAGALLWFRLGTLTGGYSTGELTAIQSSLSWRHLLDHPLNAPFLAAIHGLSYLSDHSLLLARLVAAVVGLGTLVLFYALLRFWHGERTALFGTVLFGTSAWFLHTSRLGTPDVLLFGLLALVACYLWLKHTSSGLALLALFIVIALLLYTPGMVWFVVLGVTLQWRAVDRHFKRNLWAVTVGGVLLLAALVPIGLAIYHDPSTAKIFAGLPATGWPMPFDVLKRLAEVPVHIFFRGPVAADHWLGHLPILDFFTTVMFFLGGYLYARHIKLGRFWLLAAIFIAGTALAALGGGVTLTLLIPFVYLVAAAGVGFMIDRWTTVFPRNIIAQSVGYGLISAAVLASCIYSLRHYFVAWPNAPETKAVFTVKEPVASVTIRK